MNKQAWMDHLKWCSHGQSARLGVRRVWVGENVRAVGDQSALVHRRIDRASLEGAFKRAVGSNLAHLWRMTYKRAWKESKEVARWSLVLAQRPHRTDRISTLWAVRVEARTFETNRATSEAEVTIVSPSQCDRGDRAQHPSQSRSWAT